MAKATLFHCINNSMFNPANIPASVKANLPGDFYSSNPSIPVNTNFLLQNRFVFTLSRCPTMSYFLQRVNLPSLSIGISPQSNPTPIDIRLAGNRFQFEDLQVSFPVDEYMMNYKELFDWMKGLAPYTDNVEELKDIHKTSDATLVILNSQYNPIITYKFYNIFPSFLSGLDFDVTLNDTDVVIASAVFTYTHFDIFEDKTL